MLGSKGGYRMKWFNAFQLTCMFAIAPLGIQWLHQNGMQVWGWIGLAAYAIAFAFMTIAVHEAF